MARTRLTKKQRIYVDRKADGETGVASVLGNYDTKDYMTANAISTENLQKPLIKEELKKLGFDSSNAKRVVGEILNNDYAEEQHRLNAADKIFKVNGDYAPEKHVTLTIDVNETERVASILDRLTHRRGEGTVS